jgi:hypothetical protein
MPRSPVTKIEDVLAADLEARSLARQAITKHKVQGQRRGRRRS